MVIAVVRGLFAVDYRSPVVVAFHFFPGLVYSAPRRLPGFGRRKQHRIGRHVVFFAVMDSVQEVNQKTWTTRHKTIKFTIYYYITVFLRRRFAVYAHALSSVRIAENRTYHSDEKCNKYENHLNYNLNNRYCFFFITRRKETALRARDYDSPKTIHIKNRIHVSRFKLVISTMLHIMLSDGIIGTWGTMNGSSVEFCSWASMINRPETIYGIHTIL